MGAYAPFLTGQPDYRFVGRPDYRRI